MTTKDIVTRIRAGKTTPADAETVKSMLLALINVSIDVSQNTGYSLSPKSVESVTKALELSNRNNP